MSFRRSIVSIAAFAVIYAAISLSITNSYYQLIMTLVLVWAVFGLSWNLLSGYTGLISFGHAAFFGIGAYTTALGQIYFDMSPWLLIPIAAMLGGARRPPDRFSDLPLARPLLRAGDARLPARHSLRLRVARLPGSYAADQARRSDRLHAVQRSPALHAAGAGHADRRDRADARGRAQPVRHGADGDQAEPGGGGGRRHQHAGLEAACDQLSGAIAGAIGAFYAVVLLVVTPQSVFGMLVSAQALTVAMFGGVGTVWGPVIGSVILIPLAETLNAEAGSRFPGIQGVIFGLAIIGVILVAPDGLFWKVRDSLAPAERHHNRRPRPISGPATATRRRTYRF